MNNHGDLMYSMVIAVKNTASYSWKLLRVDAKCSHHKKWYENESMYVPV